MTFALESLTQMNLSIARHQRRTLLSGVEYTTHFKLDISKQEADQIQHYIGIMMQVSIGKVDPFFSGVTIDSLRKGTEVKQRNVHKSMLIEYQMLKDLAGIRHYIAQAITFQGTYQFEIPLNIDDIDVPEGYVTVTDNRAFTSIAPE